MWPAAIPQQVRLRGGRFTQRAKRGGVGKPDRRYLGWGFSEITVVGDPLVNGVARGLKTAEDGARASEVRREST